MKIERTGMGAWIISGPDSLRKRIRRLSVLIRRKCGCDDNPVAVADGRFDRLLTSVPAGGEFVRLRWTDLDRTHRSHRFFRVKDMAPAKPIAGKKRKYFTVEEANKALPLVRMIVGDIVRQYRVVEDLQQRLSTVSQGTAASLERSLRGGTGPEPGGARRRGTQADVVHRGIETAGR